MQSPKVIRLALIAWVLLFAGNAFGQRVQVDLDLTPLLMRMQVRRVMKLQCGISTVGYRFSGTPKQEFKYAGRVYKVPEQGWIELIADKKHETYVIDGYSITITSERDQFGFRDVVLHGRGKR